MATPVKGSRSFLLAGKVEIADGLYKLDVFDDLYTILLHVFLPPSTLFIQNALLFDEREYYQSIEQYIPKPLASFIAQHLRNLGNELSIDKQSNGGWEVWSRVSTYRSPSFGYLHVDNDELLRSRSGKILSPSYGSILYVGPGSELEGGETAFLDQNEASADWLFSSVPKEEFTSPPFEFIAPVVGRLVIFNGALPHAVMWTHGTTPKPRITLLANYWSQRISSVPSGAFAAAETEEGEK